LSISGSIFRAEADAGCRRGPAPGDVGEWYAQMFHPRLKIVWCSNQIVLLIPNCLGFFP